MAQVVIQLAQAVIQKKVKIVSVHVHYFSFFSFFQFLQFRSVRLRQVTSVYVGGTGRGARQKIKDQVFICL